MIPFYEHQKKIIKDDPKKTLLALGTGSGKTRTCLALVEGKTLIICPKQQREDKTWQNNAKKFSIKCDLTVISKEDFRRDWNKLPYFDTVVFDEIHNFLGVSPDTVQRKRVSYPKTSQLFEATYNYLKKYPPKRLYLLSATPISKPMNLWGLAKLFGINWNFYEFREKYYFQILMGQRRVWIPKKDEANKQKIIEIIKKLGYTGGLNDFFDVPEQTHKEVYIDLTETQKKAIKELIQNESDPLVKRARQRTIENGVLYGKEITSISKNVDKLVDKTTIYPSNKIDYILERALEFPKMLIFANYTAQIFEIEKALKKEGYSVSTLTGETKDRANLIKTAENSKAHIVVAQSMISEGYELPSFPCVIYASKNYRAHHHIQSLGRVLRSNALKKNLYIHLIIKGGPDDACHKAILSGVDFDEKLSTLNY